MREKLSRPAALAAVALLAASSFACRDSAAPRPQTPAALHDVHITTVAATEIPDELEVPGTVVSAKTAVISARVMATVTEVAVREGDPVRQGQILVRLDDTELASRRDAARAALAEAAAARSQAAQGLTAAQAQAEVAQKTYQRFQYLREQKSVSLQEFDEVEARYRAAQAQLEAARAQQQQTEALFERAQSEARAAETVAGYARITAPFDGLVVRRYADPGALAAPGVPLLLLEQSGAYQLEVTLPVREAAVLQRGMRARVQLDELPGRRLEGTVVEFEAGAEPASHTVKAKLQLPRDAEIRSGMFGRAWFTRGMRRALAVPREAIVVRGQLHGVYVVDAEQIARLRLVTLGSALAATETAGERVEILSGLSEGERIVTNPGARELEGRKVEAEP
ncbi:MAG: efflux RND transporter periplasmic adaptor subunit [Acidobacteriia bacterium]|jgi:RND family efflux transporter MFP subunit|nr:efflux RND transporter periplasmic adaptor subunit [Terriglobia bacterium]